jgi:hypothetical protein
MLCETFKIDTSDFTQYAHKSGLSIDYEPISGLPDKLTMDGAVHDDVIANKATYTIRLNPVTPAVAEQILTAYRQPNVFLTIRDVATGEDVVKLCKTGKARVANPFVRSGAAVLWQLDDLVFREK